MKRSKKYQELAKQVDKSNLYESTEALALAKKTATSKFDETIEVHIKTGCDGRHAEQQVRGEVVLPHGTGKSVKVLVFAKGVKLDEAQAAGADHVGGEELIPKIQNDGWLDFDVVVATPDMMGVVGRLGRVLGPKGLMPNPKAGTVTMDVRQGKHYSCADWKSILYRRTVSGQLPEPYGCSYQGKTERVKRPVYQKLYSSFHNGAWRKDQCGKSCKIIVDK